MRFDPPACDSRLDLTFESICSASNSNEGELKALFHGVVLCKQISKIHPFKAQILSVRTDSTFTKCALLDVNSVKDLKLKTLAKDIVITLEKYRNRGMFFGWEVGTVHRKRNPADKIARSALLRG